MWICAGFFFSFFLFLFFLDINRYAEKKTVKVSCIKYSFSNWNIIVLESWDGIKRLHIKLPVIPSVNSPGDHSGSISTSLRQLEQKLKWSMECFVRKWVDEKVFVFCTTCFSVLVSTPSLWASCWSRENLTEFSRSFHCRRRSWTTQKPPCVSHPHLAI